MFYSDINHKHLSEIPEEIMQPIADVFQTVDWDQEHFSRKEKPLMAGKLIEYPFIMHGAMKYPHDDAYLIETTNPLREWLNEQYPGYIWMRGEIATLLPNSTLGWHVDGKWFHAISHRLHIPVTTNDDCFQIWKHEKVHFDKWNMYEINNLRLHSAENQGTECRTHIIFDICHPELRTWIEYNKPDFKNRSGLFDTADSY